MSAPPMTMLSLCLMFVLITGALQLRARVDADEGPSPDKEGAAVTGARVRVEADAGAANALHAGAANANALHAGACAQGQGCAMPWPQIRQTTKRSRKRWRWT